MMTIDQCLQKIEQLYDENPDMSNYQQILKDAFKIMFNMTKAIKDLQDEVAALKGK